MSSNCPHIAPEMAAYDGACGILTPIPRSTFRRYSTSWLCVMCNKVGCARDCNRAFNKHALYHAAQTGHNIVVSVNNLRVFCYKCEDYIRSPLLKIHKDRSGSVHFQYNPELQKIKHLDYVDKQNILDYLKCGICTQPVVEPTAHASEGNGVCSQLYCADCVRGIKKCPRCSYDVPQWKIIAETPPVQRFILQPLEKLEVMCKVCKSIVTRSSIASSHASDCVIDCVLGCGKKVSPQRIKEHKNNCTALYVQCKAHDVKCTWYGHNNDVLTHEAQCSYYKLRNILKSWATEVQELKQQQSVMLEEMHKMAQQIQELKSTK